MLDILQSIPAYIIPFIILIGILVFVHELGHFLAARWCGMRADVFAVGMGPRLFGWNQKTGFTFGKVPDDLELNGGTDYRISAFPIGGYVKIAGMVDESMDTEFTNKPPQPWEFRSKSTLQKAFVISAGVIMNMLLAIFVFSALAYFQPAELRDTTELGYLPVDSAAFVAGLRSGDKILKINDSTVSTFEDIDRLIYVDQADSNITFAVERKGAVQTVKMLRMEIPDRISGNPSILPYSRGMLVRIDEITGAPAEKAGLKKDDTVLSVDSIPISSVEQFKQYVQDHKQSEMLIHVKRGNETLTRSVRAGDDGLIGVRLGAIYLGPKKLVTYGVFGALEEGVRMSVRVVENVVNLIGALFSGKARLKDSVGGPVAIASIAKEAFAHGIEYYIRLLAGLSVMLAVMNILPVPALDGGHLVFIMIEGIIRREVPLKVRLAIQQAGVVLLLVFMAYVLYNDIIKQF